MADDDDENPNLVDSVLSSIKEAALDSDPAADADSQRDPDWLRWLKFSAVIAVPAILLGLGFLFEDYFEQYRTDDRYERKLAQHRVEQDTRSSMELRFWAGAGIGGGLGLIYVVRCIVRKTDP